MESRIYFHIEKDNEDDEFQKSFEEIISTLPKGSNWGTPEELFQYQGFWFQPTFLHGVISAQQQFQAQPTDIILCSAMKTGTAWLKSLTFAIITRISFDESTTPLLSKMPHDIVPFMELDHAKFTANRDLGIPLLATHVPYPLLPRSIIDSGCKIIYICREPKDTFVSLYHFVNRWLKSKNKQPLKLDEAFELFCEGECFYGPYWEHVLGHWNASLKHPDNFFFLKYEDLIEDTVLYVKKLAEFVGHPFSSAEEEKGVPENIVKMCSIKNLSNLEVNKSGSHRDGMVENKIYFRKGRVGDWKNCLRPEMAARLDSITQQKLRGFGVESLNLEHLVHA